MRTLVQYGIPHDSVRPGAEEILSLLRPTGDTRELLVSVIAESLPLASRVVSFNGGFLVTDEISFDSSSSVIRVAGIPFSVGKRVFNMLRDSEQIALFVCTAGDEIYEESRALIDQGDYLQGYVFDIYGSLAVESAMDYLHNAFKARCQAESMRVTNRYSPGYCGWDVGEQQKLFSMLPDGYCGITLNSSSLMHPIKSVSGIIGAGRKVTFNDYSCNACDYENCIYRNIKHH